MSPLKTGFYGGGGGTGPCPPCPACDTNIFYSDSFNLEDALAGELGPIQTQDSIDLRDEFVTYALILDDFILVDDEFNVISGLVVNDSFALFDQLAGELGPIQTQDSIDITEDPVFGPLVVQESFDIDDVYFIDQLAVQAQDSIDLDDALVEVALNNFLDSLELSDSFDTISQLQTVDSLEINDFLNEIQGLPFDDEFSINDTINQTTIDTDNGLDSLVIADNLSELNLSASDLIVVSDTIDPDELNITEYSSAVISSTSVTNPTNILDDVTDTSATIVSTASTLGNPPVVNYNITVDFSDLNIADLFNHFDAANVNLEWAVIQTGLVLSATHTSTAAFSGNDGTGFTNLSPTLTSNNQAKITTTWSLGTLLDTPIEFNGARFRLTGSIDGGSTCSAGTCGITLHLYRVWITTSTIV